jgi:photosystem II stability/assembly factor-like uncharacterized protein
MNASMFSDGTAFVSNSGDRALVFKSSNFGLTWKPMTVSPFDGFGTVRFGSPSIGYAASGSRVYRTLNGGATWTRLAGPPTGSDMLFVDVLGAELSHAGAARYAAPVFVSDDRGGTWRRTDLPLKGYADRFSMYDARHWALRATEFKNVGNYSSSFRNSIMVTDDGGRTLREVLSCTQKAPHFGCTSVGMASPSRIVAGWASGETSLSEDGGATFRSGQKLDPSMGLRSDRTGMFWVAGIAFASPTVGYAMTNGAGMWRTADGGRTWKLELAPQLVYGIAVPELAVGDASHAIAAGPSLVAARNVP